ARARTECPASRAALTVSRPIPLLAPMIRTVATVSCSQCLPGSPIMCDAAAPQDGAGKLETLHRTAGPYSPSNADRGGAIPLRLIEQTDRALKNPRSRADRSIEAFRAE